MDLPIKEATETCNARPRWKEEGYCQLPAGFKTTHEGVGRCYLHGGAGSLPRKFRLYSEVFKDSEGGGIKALYDELRELDPEDVERLDEDITLLRATMLMELSEDKLSPTHLAGYMNALAKLVRTKIEIEKGLKSRIPNVAIEETSRVLSQAIDDILGDYPDLKANLISRIREYLEAQKEPGDDKE